MAQKNGEGRREYVTRCFLEAETVEDLAKIEKQLESEGVPRGTVSGIKSDLRKKGLLPTGRKAVSLLPAKLDDKHEQLIPEYLLKYFVVLDDGRALNPLEVLLLFQAARRSVAEDLTMLQGLVETQARATETQLKVLREAKSESQEVAARAAEETAARVAAYFDQRKPDIASTPSPMEGFAARAMESLWNNILGKTLGGTPGAQPQSQVPPGWVDKTQGGQS
jgi:hypothetical protein